MSSHISLNHFVQKAQQAVSIGGSLEVNKKNELVVTGSNWLGRCVQSFKEHFFPNAVRRQNQKVLSALQQTLRQEVGSNASSRASLDVARSAKSFTKDLASMAARNQTSVLKRQSGTTQKPTDQEITNRARARHAAQVYFEKQQGWHQRYGEGLFRNLPPKEQALKRHVFTLSTQGQEAFQNRYTRLLESLVSDPTLAGTGQIPGGGGDSYGGVEGATRLQRAAFLITAEASYTDGKGDLPRAGEQDRPHYGLGNEAEVAWVRQKLAGVGDRPLEPLPPRSAPTQQTRTFVPADDARGPSEHVSSRGLSPMVAKSYLAKQDTSYAQSGEKMFEGLPPEEAALKRHVVTLDPEGKEAFQQRYLGLIDRITGDQEFAKSFRIPGGSGEPYIRGGNINERLAQAAYLIAADDARGGAGTEGYLYGLGDQDEVAWVRGKLGGAGSP